MINVVAAAMVSFTAVVVGVMGTWCRLCSLLLLLMLPRVLLLLSMLLMLPRVLLLFAVLLF